MARFHGKVLGLARLAAILSCVGSFAPEHAAADPASSFGTPAHGVHSSLAFPGEGPRELPNLPERYFKKNDWPFFDFFDRAVLQSYVRAFADKAGTTPPTPNPEEICFSGDHPVLQKARSASLFLLTVYENGNWVQGTGTIVKGSGAGGSDRILTAAHVVEANSRQDAQSEIEAIYAYDGSGLYLGSLRVVLRGDHHVIDRQNEIAREEGLPDSNRK